MKKLLLMMILITFDVHAICIMTSHTDGSISVVIDDIYQDWSSLSMGEKDSCRSDRIRRKNKEIAKEQQKNIKQVKSDVYSSCIISTNSDGSKAAVIDDIYQDWSRLSDTEKAFCLSGNTSREKETKNEQAENIKQSKPNEHYLCIMFTLDNNWVAEIDGKYYDWYNLSEYQKATCQKDKIVREKKIKNEHEFYVYEIQQEESGSIIWLIIVIIFGFLLYHSW